MSQLPGIAGEIEAIIGLEATVRLLRERGGTEITIPQRAEGTMLAGIIGELACEKLRDQFGAGRVVLPCAGMRGLDAERRRRKAEAVAMIRDGASSQEVALACDLSLRAVENYRAELRHDNQLDLGL